MRLTEALLRNIIREEIKNTISSLEEGLYHASTDLGIRGSLSKPKKSNRSPTSAPPQTQRPSGYAAFPPSAAEQKLEAVRRLSNDLSEIDKDYVKSIIPASTIERYASWVGPELKEKLDELSLRYYESYGKLTAQDAFNEFKALVEKYSPTRAKKDFVGSVTRGLSSFGLGTKTKE